MRVIHDVKVSGVRCQAIRCQMADDRGQRTDDRGQMTDVGLQLSEDREQIIEIIYFQSTVYPQPFIDNFNIPAFRPSGIPAFSPAT
jgi:hypothetical protein